MTLWNGHDDPKKPLGERIASLEAKVQLILVGLVGLIVGQVWLGILVMTRGN